MKRNERKIPRFRGADRRPRCQQISSGKKFQIVRIERSYEMQKVSVWRQWGKETRRKACIPSIDSVRFIRIRREEKREREGRVYTCVQRMSGTRSRDRDFMVGE